MTLRTKAYPCSSLSEERSKPTRPVRILAVAALMLAGACGGEEVYESVLETTADNEFQIGIEAEPALDPWREFYPTALDYRDPAILTLQEGEQLELEFHSSGCFHSYHYRFLIKGGERLVANIYKGANSTDTGVFRGSVKLTQQDARQLDTAIAFYRTNPPGWSTTGETFSLVWNKGDMQTTEQLTDCKPSLNDLEQPILTFYELALRAQ